MAFIQCDFYSETLATRSSLNAIIPIRRASEEEDDDETGFPDSPYPVLFLLHGLHSNYTAWSRFSSIERYANKRGLTVIMPDAGRSFYTNMAQGYRYFDFFANELPEIVNQLFPLSKDREDRFIAGLSMGGYGAFKLAFSRPEQYSAAASLSGPLVFSAIENSESMLPDWPLIFGSDKSLSNPDDDLVKLAQKYQSQSSERYPLELMHCCGNEDPFAASNQAFETTLREMGVPASYQEGQGGHEWSYWDQEIERVIDWLPLRDKDPKR